MRIELSWRQKALSRRSTSLLSKKMRNSLTLITSRILKKSQILASPLRPGLGNYSSLTVTQNTSNHLPDNRRQLPQKTINTIERVFSVSSVLAKGKQKGEKKKPGKAQNVDMNEISSVVDVDKFMGQMNYHIEEMKKNFIANVTLRSSVGSIEQILVNFEGEDYMLQELVQISRKPKMVVLSVTTFPQAIPQVLEAIRKSGLNLNPQQDGTTLFIPIPKITKEYREGLAKNAKALYIKCRDNLKDAKNREVKNLKKVPSISEDQIRRVQSQLETICENYVKEAETLLDTKQKELHKTND